jgi:hypothetical protein
MKVEKEKDRKKNAIQSFDGQLKSDKSFVKDEGLKIINEEDNEEEDEPNIPVVKNTINLIENESQVTESFTDTNNKKGFDYNE